MTAPLLHLDSLTKLYKRGGLFGREEFRAVDNVSFHIHDKEPQVFTIIGESGSGKTTLARMVLNMIRPTTGTIFFKGQDLASIRSGGARRRFMKEVQPIFQNPFEAFNPLKRVDRYLYMTAKNFTDAHSPAQLDAAADAALNKVGLSIGEVRGRFPHELSGGQLQRVAIARALIPGPSMIVADEPVSMVDASLRMSIVNLFRTLRDDLKVSIIYITHDLATAYYVSDRIIIMRKGEVVESGLARVVLENPQHEYSRLLKSAVLSPDPRGQGVLIGDSAASQQARASPHRQTINSQS
ncbi:ATP-binding cassette domain-containing protein [Rhizobium sp. XQZ8]|uniref:ABC transporter ATP-binding protein n=1 Tax=Rhizobium populisoli TaxID=2859785 RepID=UPI001CA5764B|nr:ATP-binding cassette domain-containing protein [Rhizobium populisoli]MBW6425942.1 ATP-binding cassette domain-containing protein [Rhizobium populisoli]